MDRPIEKEGYCLYVTYGNLKKKIFVGYKNNWKDFEGLIKQEFNIIDQHLRFIEKESEAEISSVAVLEPNLNLVIKTGASDGQYSNVSHQIPLEELTNQIFSPQGLLKKVNEWSLAKNFKVVYREGIKPLKKGWKREMRCPFRIIFKSNELGTEFKIDLVLSAQYNKHIGILNLLTYFYCIGHEMNLQKTDEFTNEIEEKINELKGKMKNMRTLTKYINKKFQANFPIYRIQYKVQKFLVESYGKAEEDAYNFIELAEKDIKDNGGFFFYEKDQESKFQRGLYISKVMSIYSKKFLDVIIIDSTYKRNRFNLPLVNVIGINNLGQNIILAFALLSNETKESYDWVFKKLKLAWKNEPLNIVCDECPSLNAGNYSIFSILIYRY